MKTQYYRVESAGTGAYDFRRDGTILAVTDKDQWLLTDEWCGGNLHGYCYRQHVDGKKRAWPKAAEKAEDKVSEFENYFADCEYKVFAAELNAKEIRDMLKV